jgi:hypothetical protein
VLSSQVINPYRFAAAGDPIMWKELDRITTTSPETAIDTGTFADKPYLMFLFYSNGAANGGNRARYQFNSDQAGNYADNSSNNGASSFTDVNANFIYPTESDSNYGEFSILTANNTATEEKLTVSHSARTSSTDATAWISRFVGVGKWDNTSNAITSAQIESSTAGATGGTGVYPFNTGAEIVVLGYDPDDTDTTGSFWEELANVSYDVNQTVKPQIDTGVFDAKKYLWVQAWIKESTDPDTWFGYGASGTLADSTGDYAWRYNDNGGTDGFISNATTAGWGMGATTRQLNFFIVNQASYQKLYFGNVLGITTTGAGAVPIRREFAGKGVDTSNPIRRIAIGHTSYTAYAGTTIKVWGSD